MKLNAVWNWELGIGILEDNVFGQLKPFPPTQTERRKEPRFSMSLPIRYRQRGRFFPWRQARSIDISRNGVRLALNRNITIGAEVDLDIKLPEMKKPVRLEGVIVWANPSANSLAVSECGVAFKNLRKLSNREKLMYFMADKICSLSDKHNRDLTVRPARIASDMEKIYRLIYREYLARGYCSENLERMHYTVYSLFPESRAFLLEKRDELYGTISLIPDSPCGLPMESLFPEETHRFRCAGRHLAEVSLLALNQEFFQSRTFTLTDFQKLTGSFRLFKILFDYARMVAGVTDLFLVMHPKHKELYRYLNCEIIGPVKSYPEARGNPALPMHLDIEKTLSMGLLRQGIGDYFLKNTTPIPLLRNSFSWSAETVKPFLANKTVTPSQEGFLKSCYPGLQITGA